MKPVTLTALRLWHSRQVELNQKQIGIKQGAELRAEFHQKTVELLNSLMSTTMEEDIVIIHNRITTKEQKQ
jgi:hypothetical protein